MIGFVDDSHFFYCWVKKHYPEASFYFSEIDLLKAIEEKKDELKLVFMDQLIDGYDALDDNLPLQYAQVKFVLLTANRLLSEEKKDLLEKGFKGYVSKLSDDLHKEVENWIKNCGP